jgi:uncharacterized membrane protein
MFELVLAIIEWLSLFLSFVGVILVLFGSILAAYHIFTIEVKRPKNTFHKYEDAKRVFIQKLIFALDFFVAADILKLVVRPSSLEELFVIGGIVAIRTTLSHFLGKEIHLHKRRQT